MVMGGWGGVGGREGEMSFFVPDVSYMFISLDKTHNIELIKRHYGQSRAGPASMHLNIKIWD